MPMHNDIVVRIAGREHAHWMSYSIDSDFLTPADAFDFAIGMPAAHDVIDDFAGETAEVEINGQHVLTGIVDSCRHALDKQSRTFAISGRDRASLLVDCSTPLTNVKGLTMMAAIKKIAEPLGITEIKHQGEADPNVDKVDIEPGERAWDAIKHLANYAGLHPWFDPDGTLIIGGADYSQPPVATLICNPHSDKNNIKRIELETDISNRFSEVTFLAQRHGRPTDGAKHDLSWTYKDPGIPLHRPRTVVLSDVEDLAALKKAAKKQISDWRLEGFTLSITIADHKTQDGTLWTPGQRVHVISQEYGIDDIYFLMGRRFKLNRSEGTVTELRLKEDGIWTPDAYPDKAKKAEGRKGKRKGRRKKKKRELAIV